MTLRVKLANQPIVLISQVQRSGGTLLSQMFDGHPNVFAHPHELQWGWPEKWDWPNFDDYRNTTAQGKFKLLLQPWLCRDASSGFYIKEESTQDHPIKFRFDIRKQWGIFNTMMNSAPAEKFSNRDILVSYMSSFFNTLLDEKDLFQDKKVITAFSPMLISSGKSRQRFWSDYPDGTMISIIRNPESWASSATKQSGLKLTKIMEYWNSSTSAAIETSQEGRNILIVLFDDLVQNPRETLEAICAKIGLPFHECLLEPTFLKHSVVANSSFDRNRTGIQAEFAEREAALRPEDSDIAEGSMPLYEAARELAIKPTLPG